MSQHDLVVANDTFPNVRSDLNAGLQALGSNQSGGSAPGTTYPYMWWADTTLGILRRRNAANSGWVIGDTLAESYVAAKSANYTLGVADHERVMSCTSSFTLLLTAAATLGDGWRCAVRNDGTGIVTIDGDGSEQIDGATTVLLGPGESCLVYCTGSAFKTIGRREGSQTFAFNVHRNGTNQTGVASATWTKFAPTTEGFDLGGAYDLATDNRFECLVPGAYLFTGKTQPVNPTDGMVIGAAIYKNGALANSMLTRCSTAASASDDVSVTAILSLVAGDYVEMYVYHARGTTEDFNGSATVSYFAGARL